MGTTSITEKNQNSITNFPIATLDITSKIKESKISPILTQELEKQEFKELIKSMPKHSQLKIEIPDRISPTQKRFNEKRDSESIDLQHRSQNAEREKNEPHINREIQQLENQRKKPLASAITQVHRNQPTSPNFSPRVSPRNIPLPPSPPPTPPPVKKRGRKVGSKNKPKNPLDL